MPFVEKNYYKYHSIKLCNYPVLLLERSGHFYGFVAGIAFGLAICLTILAIEKSNKSQAVDK